MTGDIIGFPVGSVKSRLVRRLPVEDTHPKYDAELYADCVTLISRGLKTTLNAEESVVAATDAMKAATFLLALLDKAVKP